jgi:uncharacterized RDD family membrane protein YckC
MAFAEYSVLTPERVSLQYDIAGIGSRGAAAVVDTAIQAVSLLVVVLGLAGAVAAGGLFQAGGFSSAGRLLPGLLLGVFALSIFAVTNGYFILFEIIWSGQTPGKRLVGLRVMRENGYPIRPIDAVIRNLVRIVDWLPGLYGVGVLTMLLNKRSRRLGDYASGTIVVREASRGGSAGLVMPDVSESSGYALSSTDATLVRDFLVRRATLSASARAELAARLAAALAQRYSRPLNDSAPERFLEEFV